MPTVETFLFDLDGTLTDSVADLTFSINLLREEMGLEPLEAATVRPYIGDGASALVRRSLPEGLYSEERLRHFRSIYGAHLLDQTLPYPGIVPFLEAHRDRPMAVVTNKPLFLALPLLEGLDLRRFFPVVLGGDSCPTKKPDPAPLLSALQGLEAAPQGAVMIGDHHTDLRAGRAAGLRTCFCSWGIGNDGGIPSDFRAATPADLQGLFPGAG